MEPLIFTQAEHNLRVTLAPELLDVEYLVYLSEQYAARFPEQRSMRYAEVAFKLIDEISQDPVVLILSVELLAADRVICLNSEFEFRSTISSGSTVKLVRLPSQQLMVAPG